MIPETEEQGGPVGEMKMELEQFLQGIHVELKRLNVAIANLTRVVDEDIIKLGVWLGGGPRK